MAKILLFVFPFFYNFSDKFKNYRAKHVLLNVIELTSTEKLLNITLTNNIICIPFPILGIPSLKENLYSAVYYSPVKCSSAAENRALYSPHRNTCTRAEGAEITNAVNIVT
jgi:hypothetical protein